MSTATMPATMNRNGNPPATAPSLAPAASPTEFSPAVQAQCSDFLGTIRPLNLFMRAATEVLDAMPEGEYKYQKPFNFGEGAKAEEFFVYFRNFSDFRLKTHALAKTSVVGEWNALIAKCTRAYRALASGKRDARDEENRKAVLSCLKSVNPKFVLTFFMDAVADGCDLLVRYKDHEGTAISVSQQVNRYVKAMKDGGTPVETVDYAHYRAWQMGTVKPTVGRTTRAVQIEAPADLDSLAGEW